jgi:assimilatory nitrate reductase catalytic subunit
MVGGRAVEWNTALDAVADGLRRIAEQHGSDAIAFYLSGQLLTEDYYVANKLAKGFIGTSHVDTNSRLCMASSVAGHRRVFGSDTVPGTYEDLDCADLIVLVGSNAAWCHPVLFQRMVAARAKRGTRLVVIDPRGTATSTEADLHLKLAPGSDTVLFAGLLLALAGSTAFDAAYVAAHTTGLDAILASACAIAPNLETIARRTQLQPSDIVAFYDAVIATHRTVTCYSQGVNQSAQGTDKVTTILACHLATGRVGKPGMGPFSLTGQPNAMGGREVGGLANMLAAHMGYTTEEIDRVRRFWGAPRMAAREGLKAVQMFEAIERGDIKALWILGTNPAVSLPRADHMRAALAKLDLLVVSENVTRTDTVMVGTHVLLPAAAWAEKDGTVTNSERRISRQRAVLPLPGRVKPDWSALSEVAKRLGFGEAFAYRNAAQIFREHAALSAFENDGTRDFDIGALAKLTDQDYDALPPTLWPAPANRDGEERFFAAGGYFTPDRRARFLAPADPALASSVDPEHPFLLSTGRFRDQWHTMTRTGRSPRLGHHAPVPTLALHPDDAAECGLKAGDLACITSVHGRAALAVEVTTAQRRGEAFAPIHWTAETSSHGRIGAVVQAATDPFSGQPEMKATRVTVTAVKATLCGFVLARRPVIFPAAVWWARVAVPGAIGYRLMAGIEADEILNALSAEYASAEAVTFADAARRVRRVGFLRGGRLEACCFLAPIDAPVHWDTVVAAFAESQLEGATRRAVLSAQAAGGRVEHGPIVCACFGVGLSAIRDAITSGRAASVEALGSALRAGTNCGSCRPELKTLLENTCVDAATAV